MLDMFGFAEFYGFTVDFYSFAKKRIRCIYRGTFKRVFLYQYLLKKKKLKIILSLEFQILSDVFLKIPT